MKTKHFHARPGGVGGQRPAGVAGRRHAPAACTPSCFAMLTAIGHAAALEAAGRQLRLVLDPQSWSRPNCVPSRGQRSSGVIPSPSETI